MKQILVVLRHSAIIYCLAGCTMEVDEPSSASPVSEPLSSPTSPVINTNNTTQPAKPTIPITWSDLNLIGKLVYSTVSTDGINYVPKIQMLDLGTGEITTI